MGTSSVGQGVETVFAQIAADALEVPIERIHHVYHGSTAYVSDGYGAYHSRSTVMGGSAVLDATNNFMATLRQAAGKRLGCAESNVTLDIDKVTGGGRSMALSEFAGLTAEGAFLNKKHTYSYGAHVCHITVDARLGRIEIVDYVVVQDVGRAVNPLTLRGQVLGSLVQGLGGAVLEDLKYDENGQFLTGSLADYLLADRDRLPQSALRRARRLSVADQSARRQGRGRGRHHRRRRLHGQRGGECAVVVRRAAARAAAVADLYLGTGAGRPAQGGGVAHSPRVRHPGRCAQRSSNGDWSRTQRRSRSDPRVALRRAPPDDGGGCRRFVDGTGTQSLDSPQPIIRQESPMSVARHPRPKELEGMPVEEIMKKFVGRYSEKRADWAAFEDAKIEGFKRAQHRFIGAGGSGKHDDPTVIPAKNFTLSIMYVPPGQGNAAHTHEVEECFFVLQGHLDVFVEDETGKRITTRLWPWECIACPAGVIHGYQNDSLEPVYFQVMIGRAKPETMGYADDELYKRRDAHLKAV